MRRIHLLRSIGALLVACAAVPVFIAIFNYLQVFQILANR